jgi:hypothetical protein
MNRRTSRILIAWLALASMAPAQSASAPGPVDMAQLQIGKAFPFPPAKPDAEDTMAAQLGWYTFDAPNTANSPLPFAHYQVGINDNTRVVYYIRGVRQYSSKEECFKDLQSVAEVMRSRYGIPPKVLHNLHRDSYFEGVSADNHVEASCGTVGRSPYVQLALTVMSLSQKKELEAIRKKKYAR